jgi:hypothetical protein
MTGNGGRAIYSYSTKPLDNGRRVETHLTIRHLSF